MTKDKLTKISLTALASALMVVGTANAGVLTSSDGLATGFEPDPATQRTSLSVHNEKGAQSRMPMLDSATQIPMREGATRNPFGVGSQAFGAVRSWYSNKYGTL